MQVTKYKITAKTAPGYMMVVYQDNVFKSVLNEFKPSLNEKQLNFILNLIPNDPKDIPALFKPVEGKLSIAAVKPVGAEPALQSNEPLSEAKEYPVNEKVALWCEFYMAHHTDVVGADVKYKAGAAEIGKLKALVITPAELELLFDVYFKSNDWWAKPKCISNFINKYNEVRALAYTKPAEKTFPLPYDELFYLKADTMGKKAYHAFLREKGYRFEVSHGRGAGKWVNDRGTI